MHAHADDDMAAASEGGADDVMAAVAAMRRRDRALADSLPPQAKEPPAGVHAPSSESDDEVGGLPAETLGRERQHSQSMCSCHSPGADVGWCQRHCFATLQWLDTILVLLGCTTGVRWPTCHCLQPEGCRRVQQGQQADAAPQAEEAGAGPNRL